MAKFKRSLPSVSTTLEVLTYQDFGIPVGKIQQVFLTSFGCESNKDWNSLGVQYFEDGRISTGIWEKIVMIETRFSVENFEPRFWLDVEAREVIFFIEVAGKETRAFEVYYDSVKTLVETYIFSDRHTGRYFEPSHVRVLP